MTRRSYLRLWLAVGSVLLIALNLLTVAGADLSLARIAQLGPAAWITLTVLSAIAGWSVLYCWRVFYKAWWCDNNRPFGERFFWAIALLGIPYGLLLYYFMIYRNRLKPQGEIRQEMAQL